MKKPCNNCGCLKTAHGVDVEFVTTLLGNAWVRYLRPCLTAGCHCADYEYRPGITGGYGKGDGVVTVKDPGLVLAGLAVRGL